MQRSKNIIFNICFALNCLLVFLLFFQNKLSIPLWLQVVGRMHPLLLHLPISFLLLSIIWLIVIEKRNKENLFIIETGDWLLLISALTASLTALMGLLLSKEPNYESDALFWHKWDGIILSLIIAAWYAFRKEIRLSKRINITFAVSGFILVCLTGHLGSTITHGQDYLIEPILTEQANTSILLEEAYVYKDMVKPILQAKCMRCHNNKKSNGELNMSTEELLLKGGKSGKLWDLSEKEYGLLLERIHLPEELKKHMPPKGKPQLTEDEARIIYYWIKSGADFKKKVIEFPEQDTLRILAAAIFKTIETDHFDFSAASDATIKKLNTNYRAVYPLSINSPALGVDIYGAPFYNSNSLKELLEVKDKIVSLNLNKMPVNDEDLKTIGSFINLRKLNLSFTNITGKTLNELGSLNKLKSIALSGNSLTPASLNAIKHLPSLSRVYLWSTSLKQDEISQLQKSQKQFFVETGFSADTVILQLNPPIFQNETKIIDTPLQLKLKHYIKGVTLRYSTDGTIPDSIQSPVYNDHVLLTSNVTVKVKAFKPGWIGSDVAENHFYSAKFKADSIVYILPADSLYKGESKRSLIDLHKTESNNFRNPQWVGFQKNNLEAILFFKKPTTLSTVTFSSLVDIGSFIFPAVKLEVWGANELGKWKKLGSLEPEQPTIIIPSYQKAFDISFKPETIKYLRVMAVPVSKIPKWHPGKGKKGWFFIDEIFLN